MNESGYEIQHSSIIHGINSVSERVKDDADYMQIVKEIDKAVFIKIKIKYNGINLRKAIRNQRQRQN